MTTVLDAFEVSKLYSNEEIYKSLSVGNAGGVRVKTTPLGEVDRLVIFTSAPTTRQLSENPYHDRLEGDVLVYTGAGRAGDQSVSGPNARIVQQQDKQFPIYGFVQMRSRRDPSMGNKRWAFLGLVEYLRCYRERQVDSLGNWRNVWVFELHVHSSPSVIHKATDREEMGQILANRTSDILLEDREVVSALVSEDEANQLDLSMLEPIRRQLLASISTVRPSPNRNT